jgi:HEAT repeat protein
MSFAALLLSTVPFLFQGEDPAEAPPLRWDRSLDAALAQAKKANSWVLVALPPDYEGEGHGALSGAFWNFRGLRKAAAKGRAVVGSSYKHAEHEGGVDRDGNTLDKYCSRFGQLVCDQHREIEKQVVARYFDGLEPPTRPVFLVLRGSDGKVLARRLGDPTANELADLMRYVGSIIAAGDEPAVPSELLGKTSDADAETRSRALRVLAALEFPSADEARKKLLENAKDDNQRAEILVAIAEAGSRTLRDVAMAQLESKSLAVRSAAARALGGPGLADAVDPLIKAYGKARDDEERKWIVRALGRASRASETGKDMLKKAINDNKALIRANAAVALGEACGGDGAAIKLLKQHIEGDSDPKVRGAAVYALTMARAGDTKETISYLRARKPKEKDPKVVEMLNSGITYLDGTLENDLLWALQGFCGDPVK